MYARPLGLKSVQGLMSVYQNLHQQKIPVAANEAFLAKDAAEDLYKANINIIDEGGRLYVSSMWRTPDVQYKAWLDHQNGRKTTYSPPPCMSMHECGRAMDIDVRPDQLKISHEKIRAILIKCNWFPVVPIGTPGEWHYEHRNSKLKSMLQNSGYRAMVDLAFSEIKYKSLEYDGVDYDNENVPTSWM